MKKLSMLFALCSLLSACTFPLTPGEGNLLNGSKQHRAELFESGARGQVIVSMTDNISSDGFFFGKKYEQKVSFKNLGSAEVFHLSTKLGSKEFDTAMLPIGDYEVTNLYLQYVYTTTHRQGNAMVTTTHIETIEHFENNNKVQFSVKPAEVAYLGNIELIKADNKVDAEGKRALNSFKITDESAKISDKQKSKWEKEFGKPLVVRLAASK